MGIDTDSMLGIGIIMAASLIGGWLLFRLIETPFMDMRAKLYPADIATGQVAPNQAEARPEHRKAA
jgi:peptidoglycan/LPS O-acetylase OafA/YrhL